MILENTLVAISLSGAWAVSEPTWARTGFALWVVANLGWVWVFTSQGQNSPAFMFAVYAVLAVNGLRRSDEHTRREARGVPAG